MSNGSLRLGEIQAPCPAKTFGFSKPRWFSSSMWSIVLTLYGDWCSLPLRAALWVAAPGSTSRKRYWLLRRMLQLSNDRIGLSALSLRTLSLRILFLASAFSFLQVDHVWTLSALFLLPHLLFWRENVFMHQSPMWTHANKLALSLSTSTSPTVLASLPSNAQICYLRDVTVVSQNTTNYQPCNSTAGSEGRGYSVKGPKCTRLLICLMSWN